MSASTYFRDAAVDLFVNTAVYVGLCTADPGDNNDPEAEVSTDDWPSYVRVPLDPATAWTTPVTISSSAQETENVVQINYPQHDGSDPVTITFIAFYDAATDGNLIARSQMALPITYQPGDGAAISVGGLRFRAN